jgi:hypothetical protein
MTITNPQLQLIFKSCVFCTEVNLVEGVEVVVEGVEVVVEGVEVVVEVKV